MTEFVSGLVVGWVVAAWIEAVLWIGRLGEDE